MKEADYILIEKYLDNSLKSADLAVVEHRLKTDIQFADELTLRQEMEHFLSVKTEKDALKKQLPKLSKSYFQEPEKEVKIVPLVPFYKRKIFLFGSVAAAVLLFLMIQFLLPSGSLYEQYKGEYPLALAERGGSELNLVKLEQEFAAENYAYAKVQLELYLAENPDDTRAQIAYGICLMELGDAEQAQRLFLSIYNNPKKVIFENTATWYLALSSLKQENFAKAKEYLAEIDDGEYFEKAQELQKKIASKQKND